MKIKNDNNLRRLALRADSTTFEIEEKVLALILQKKWIKDFNDETYFGVALRHVLPASTYVDEIYNALRSLGIDWVLNRDYDSFLDLKLIGDGDCPYCGGRLELSQPIVNANSEVGEEVEVLGHEYRCTHCHREVISIATPNL